MKHAMNRSGAWRSRWAAVGAALAVTLGAGGLVAVDAASSAPSSVVTVEPTRILDTRTDVGLSGPFASGVSQKLQVTGNVATQPPAGAAPVVVEVVPTGATAVVLNATAVRPTSAGFLSIRPGDATGDPATSNINWAAGGANIANSITVQLPASGQIDIFVSGAVSEVLIDVAGYMIPGAGGTPGPAGPEGPEGPAGEAGPIGETGPSDGFVFRRTSALSMGAANTPQALADLALPAGDFIVTASFVSNNNSASTAVIRCELSLGGTTIDATSTDLTGLPLGTNTQPGSRESFTLTGGGSLAAPADATIECQSSEGSGNYIGVSITAIMVGSLTIQ